MQQPAGTASPRPSDRARIGGQVAGAAVAGAIMAGTLTWIWHASLAAGRSSCTDPGQICIGPDLVGIAADVVVGVGGSLIVCAALQLRPLLASTATAILATSVVMAGGAAVAPSGQPPAAGVVVPLLAVAFALVASIFVTAGRARMAAAILTAVLLAAAVLVPRMINHSVHVNQRRAQLAALPVPLLLPAVAGYKVIGVYPVGDTLNINMVTARSRPNSSGTYDDIAMSVAIGPLSDSYLSSVLAECQKAGAGAGPAGTCRLLHPGEWATPATGTEGVIALRSRIIVSATANPPARVTVEALAEAATHLRPASMGEMLALDVGP
jgi:hypothetical protein